MVIQTQASQISSGNQTIAQLQDHLNELSQRALKHNKDKEQLEMLQAKYTNLHR